jgi:fibronectin type 3 domain-containing protein
MTSLFRFSSWTKFAACLLPAWLLAVAQPCRADAPPVPAGFQDLYTSLDNYLTSFNSTLGAPGAASPVLYTGTLTNADANAGPQLAGEGYFSGVQLQLQALKAMGVQAVMVAVGFPMLYEPFFSSQTQYQQMVSFYGQVASTVRAMGMKLVVENNCLLANDVQAGWDTAPFYSTLSWDQYQAARAQTAVTIAQTMQPDYMVVLEEPDTEARMSGQSDANTVSGSSSLLSQILTALQQSGVTGVKVGAGVGTWLPQFDQYIQAYVAQPVDFIDFHIYPVNDSFLPNALTIASIAAGAGKPVGMTEAWMWKVRDTELNVLTSDQIEARNPYSFWAPLDAYFLQTMQNLARHTQMAFLAPSASDYYWAYQDYTTIENQTPDQILSEEVQLAAQDNQQAVYSSTGLSFYSSLVTPADTAPPTTPGNVTGVSGNPNQTTVSWDAATDNVGVAGYYVLRDGVNVGTTAQTFYQDSGLTQATTYNYTIEAFDLAGNVSTASPSTPVTTADVTPPTAPASLTATAVSCQEITLTWPASNDNLGIGSYRVFWGLTPTSLTQVGTTYGTTTTFNSYPLTPSTTYYYGVEAVDQSGNVSAMSPVASAVTLALPSAPTGLAATPAAATRIGLTWVAGPSGMKIVSYHVLRGSTASSLAQIGIVKGTSYTDITVSPATTYYYAVQEVDAGGDLSPISPAVAATTPVMPSAPAGVTATASSTTKISLTWTAGPSGLAIGSYRVFQGSSASTLSQVATLKTTTYTNSSLTPGTTYYYAVEEVDTGGDVSPMSATVSAATPLPPAAPVNVTATATSTKQISLTWTAGPSGLAIGSYRIFEGTSPSSLSQVATVKSTSYTSSSLSPSTTYYYAVEEVDTAGEVSPMSATASATTLALPSPPASVTATAVSKTQIGVAWTAAQSGMALASYRVYRGTSSSNLAQIGTVSASTTSFTNGQLTAGTTYYYAIQSVDTGGNVSALSAVASATTLK